MKNNNTGMIATITATVFCGCPGLLLCIFGGWAATGSLPYSTTVNGIAEQGNVPSTVGFVLLCLALLFIATPIVIGFVTLRKKPEVLPNNEPIPPAS